MRLGYLEVRNGPLRGQRHRFMRSASIGREDQNTVHLMDCKVSRTHARIDATAQGFEIQDLRSTNGTYVNEARIERCVLGSGDGVRIGLTELLFTDKEILIDDSSRAKIATKRRVEDVGEKELDGDDLSRTDVARLRQRFLALLRINRTIGAQLDLKKAFDRILEEILLIFPAERGAVLSVNVETGSLEIVCSRTRRGSLKVEDILISRTILNKVTEESVGLLIDDAMSDERFALSESIGFGNVRSALCVPLLQHNGTIGIIYLDSPGRSNAFAEADLDQLMAIAGPASVQTQNALYVTHLKKSFRDTIQALANAVEARDPYTVGHNLRVSRLAMAVASILGLPEESQRLAELGGILHDVGKVGVSDNVLLKKGRLNETEVMAVYRHPEIGARMIMDIDFLRPIIPYVLYHHERWDGGGYPFGLKEKEVPREGRLLAVCDAFDAMTSTRPYRDAFEPEIAIEELLKNKSLQFDPNCVDAFVMGWKSGKIMEALRGAPGHAGAMEVFPDSLFAPAAVGEASRKRLTRRELGPSELVGGTQSSQKGMEMPPLFT